MSYGIFNISEWLSWACGIALFGWSIAFCYRKGSPAYLRSFPIYCFVNVVTELIVLLHPASQSITYFLFTLFELGYFSLFLSKIIQRRFVTILLWLSDGVYVGIIVYLLAHFRVIPFGVPEVGEVIVLLPVCLACYVEFFTVFITTELRREPSFWIVTGLLFYIVLLLPTLFLSQYYFSKGRPNFARLCYSVNGIALIISYFLYAKGVTSWRTK